MKVIVVFLAAVVSMFGASVYSQGFTSVTSVAIANSQHGMGSTNFGVHVQNTSGSRFAPSEISSVGINTSTYEVTITFPSAKSGTVKLYGPFNSDTSHDRDFKVEINGTDSQKLHVCRDCTTTNFARRTVSGKKIAMHAGDYMEVDSAPNAEIRVFIQDQKVVYGFTASSGTAFCVLGTNACEVRWGVSAWPSGAIKLAEVETDLREPVVRAGGSAVLRGALVSPQRHRGKRCQVLGARC